MTRRPLTLAILSLAIVACLAALALRTSELERVSMLERDGEIEAAARLANRLYDGGDRRGALLARVFELNHVVGNPHRADKALREYLAGNPDNARTLRKAAEFFELEQDLEGTLAALVNLIRVAPTASSVEKLARLYRLHGRFAEEEGLLLAQRHLLKAEFLTRLGGLLAQKGDVAGALSVLRSADERFPAEQEQFASLLFDLLVGQNALDEALVRASRWAGRDTDPYPRMPMILRFVEAGAKAPALALAGVPLASAATSSDVPKAATVWTLLSRGHVDLAGDLIEQFSDARPRPERRAAMANYVSVAVATGSLGQIIHKADRLLRASDEHHKKLGLGLAAILFEKWGFAGLGPLRAHLSFELVSLDPLFAAQLALAERQPAMAGFHLSRVELAETDEALTRQWRALAQEALRPADLAEEMMRRHQEGSLPSALVADLQLAIRKAGLFIPRFDPFGGQGLAGHNGQGTARVVQ